MPLLEVNKASVAKKQTTACTTILSVISTVTFHVVLLQKRTWRVCNKISKLMFTFDQFRKLQERDEASGTEEKVI